MNQKNPTGRLHPSAPALQNIPLPTSRETKALIARFLGDYDEDPDDCPVCLLPHDPEIHEATVSIHKWLRDQVTLAFRTDKEIP